MIDAEFPEVNARVLVLVDGDRDPSPGSVWWRMRATINGVAGRLMAFALDDGRKVGADQCEWWHEVRA